MSFAWLDNAACKDSHIDFFSDAPKKIQEALDLCETCPVRKECLKFTLDARPKPGTKGGIPPQGITGGVHFVTWPSSMRIAAIKKAEKRLREMESV